MYEKFFEGCLANSRGSINIVMIINIITQNSHGASRVGTCNIYALVNENDVLWTHPKRNHKIARPRILNGMSPSMPRAEGGLN